VRLSGRGIGLLVAAVILLVVGFWFGYPELAVLGFAAAVAVAGALAFVAWRPQLTISRAADPDRVMRGETCRVTLDVGNASRVFGTSLVARDRVRPGGTVAVPLVRLRPGRRTRVTYPVPTNRRGLVRVGPLEITRRDPLGLVGAVRRYGDQILVWVRPKIHPIGTVPIGLSRSLDGRVDRVPHGSITFAALREYVMGDDLRHVHWRTSARVGELMVREHVDTSLPRIVILLDDRAIAHGRDATGESTFESACEAAASVLVAAVQADVHIELQLVTGRAATGGPGEASAMLDLLTEAELAEPEDSGQLAAQIESLRVRRLGDTLLYLAGASRGEDLGLLAGLRGAYGSVIAGIFGPVESGLSTNAGVHVVSAADGLEFCAAWDGVRSW
jgi:uncharacterized protein (DUF58 family)